MRSVHVAYLKHLRRCNANFGCQSLWDDNHTLLSLQDAFIMVHLESLK